MPEAASTSPSEMLTYLDDALEKVLPEAEFEKLERHDAEIAVTTSHGDFHRCLRCAEWAVELGSRAEHSHLRHLVRELEGALREFHDADWAFEFGIFTPGRAITDVELAWVDDAVTVASAAAETSGWAAVPWEELLVELIGLEPNPR